MQRSKINTRLLIGIFNLLGAGCSSDPNEVGQGSLHGDGDSEQDGRDADDDENAHNERDGSTDDAHEDAGGDGDDAEPSGACEQGTSSTPWATACPSTPVHCVAGTWEDPGSTTNDPLQCESAHFAVHSPAGTITPAQCKKATDTLENIVWPTYFGATMLMPEPYCQSSQKFKASIVIRNGSGLTGGGWGNGYMGMWVGPGATDDHWGLAHEFMHAVQSQTRGLACGGPASNNFCGWIYESHANFAAHQLPEYRGDVHCSEMLVNAPHLYLGSTRDRYCNWQFMEYLKDRHCIGAVNDIWLAQTASNDPFLNIASTRGFETAELNDFIGEWALHNVTWDYRNSDGSDQGAVYRARYGKVTDTSRPERRLRTTRLLPLEGQPGRFTVHALQAPQRFGYNVVPLTANADASEVVVRFRGVTQDEANSDWRWGLVATDSALTKSRYSPLRRGADGELKFCLEAGELLFLVVAATPSVNQQIVWDQPYPTIYRYPYMVELMGARPSEPVHGDGSQWANGGGFVAKGANVASGAYVGPFASVLSGTVGAQARIEELAVIEGATVNGGTVSGLSVLRGGFTLNGNASVRLAWPYAPGFFEQPQSASGSAQLLGDLEFRGGTTSKTSGSFCGFADGTSASNCAMENVNVGKWTWRD